MRFQNPTDKQIIKAAVITEAVPQRSSFPVRLSRWCIFEFTLLHLQKARPPSTTSLCSLSWLKVSLHPFTQHQMHHREAAVALLKVLLSVVVQGNYSRR